MISCKNYYSFEHSTSQNYQKIVNWKKLWKILKKTNYGWTLNKNKFNFKWFEGDQLLSSNSDIIQALETSENSTDAGNFCILIDSYSLHKMKMKIVMQF